ncbi:IS30 family transposase [Xenorhabdus sp. Reich]|uniref:IS30 family transposase n=1 Tax=Xenorhabdus littoralis TaxID=2582835 RepID=A0ABU4SHQ0_9GAMM|nr:IS30 family transposase [Xenorhabdus sp. Reich]
MGLRAHWNSEQISQVGKTYGLFVSHAWIYQYPYENKRQGGKLWTCLRQAKRRYRKGNSQNRSPIPDAVSIEHRPARVEERSRLGDWEADLVLGKQGTGAIVTLAERCSRMYLIKKVPSKEAEVVSDAIIALLDDYKNQCFTITFDNGGEFREHKKIAKALEADMYFAHPYRSCERGLMDFLRGLVISYILVRFKIYLVI